MANIDEEILKGAEEDAKEVAFILNYMGAENKEKQIPTVSSILIQRKLQSTSRKRQKKKAWVLMNLTL